MKPLYRIKFIEETTVDQRASVRDVFESYVTIGRSSNCSIQYHDNWRSVSREHVILVADQEKLVLKKPAGLNNDILLKGSILQGTEEIISKKTKVQLGSNGPSFQILIPRRISFNKWKLSSSGPLISPSSHAVNNLQLFISYFILAISVILFMWTVFRIW